MARRPRVHFPGALYHVISRGNQGQSIYKDDEDHRRFQTLLGEVVKRHALTLYAYVLMANHFHLLLEVSRSPLAKAMQSLLYSYTRYYNQRYRKVRVGSSLELMSWAAGTGVSREIRDISKRDGFVKRRKIDFVI